MPDPTKPRKGRRTKRRNAAKKAWFVRRVKEGKRKRRRR